MNKFDNFISYLKRETRDVFYVELSEIEAIIKCSLSDSAYKYPQYWNPSGTHRFANLIAEAGFRVIPDLANKRIRLKREEVLVFNLVKENENKISKLENETNIPEPSVEQVLYWLKSWDELEDYVAQEDAIDKLFKGEFSSNSSLQNILIKCSVLNDFYSTNIFKIYPVAKHILELNIDERLKAGDPTLVDDIAHININDKEKNFYSFASKYCSHHNELEFPIYDSYVHKVLKYFKKVDKFYEFNEADLKIYPKFKNILIEFRKFYHLERFNLKELDKYLWQFGKRYFPKTY